MRDAWQEDLSDAALLATPVGYARGVLGMDLYPWQERVLADLEEPGMISLRCCNEAGKTTHVAAPAIIWVMDLFPGSQVVVTSGAWRQVLHQLFPALQRFKSRFPEWEFGTHTVRSPHGSRCVGFSTDEPGLFEGWHTGPGGHAEQPLLIIVDEAKSVAEAIFEAIDRCRPTWLLLMSSPGACTGRFYRSQTSERAHYRCHAVSYEQCPHIARSTVQSILDRYGREHWFTRSTLFGEFAEDPNSGMVLALSEVEACLEGRTNVAAQTGDVHAYCDFAAGGDENVLAVRRGNRVEIVRAWRETNTDAAVAQFVGLFREHGLKADQISGDADGLGKPMIDRLRALGWPITPVHGGAKARDDKVYANAAAEVWGEGARMIRAREIILPDDSVLIGQLTSRKWKRWQDGRLVLESKNEMRKRGVSSPDRADAVLAAMRPAPSMRATAVMGRVNPFEAWETMQEAPVLPGVDAG